MSLQIAAVGVQGGGKQSATDTAKTVAALKEDVRQREKKLAGVYQQIAVQFADLHDTPGRMAATGAVRKVSARQSILCVSHV